jgi:hypothetical protein
LREKWRDGEGLIAFVPRRLGRPLKATAAVVGFLVLIPDRRVAIALVNKLLLAPFPDGDFGSKLVIDPAEHIQEPFSH